MPAPDDIRARAREAFEAAFPGWAADIEKGSQLAEERRASFEAGFIVGNGSALGRSLAPVTGDRLLAALAVHIDMDAPPGMAAREIARTVLELLDSACNDLQPFELHQELLKLKERFRR